MIPPAPLTSATEDEIQKAMYRVKQGRTTFLITHRLSQIRWADRILVLRRGELVDQGTHEELMERCEPYRQIFASTLGSSCELGHRARYSHQQLRSRRRSDWALSWMALDSDSYDRPVQRPGPGAAHPGVLSPAGAADGHRRPSPCCCSALFDAAVPIIISRGHRLLAAQPQCHGRSCSLCARGHRPAIAGLGAQLSPADQLLAGHGHVSSPNCAKTSFTAVTRHDLSFYDEQPTGKIVSRVTSDTQDFASTVDLTMNLMSRGGGRSSLSPSWRFRINVILTLILLAMTPVVSPSWRSASASMARKVTQNARRVMAKVNANIQESVSGIAIAKGFRQESRDVPGVCRAQPAGLRRRTWCAG